ncbi:hypothetical protein BFP71_07190 [Roseivirga misakiensis]|uniref:Uncharacterized protein n=2 Tax=Roseivirga misakiensis TaxID=1563681 RepID=A0A1E5T3D1_9BACT|nr:hypothetical protein BFP71_07190 [Roseivirga misakiensis]
MISKTIVKLVFSWESSLNHDDIMKAVVERLVIYFSFFVNVVFYSIVLKVIYYGRDVENSSLAHFLLFISVLITFNLSKVYFKKPIAYNVSLLKDDLLKIEPSRLKRYKLFYIAIGILGVIALPAYIVVFAVYIL